MDKVLHTRMVCILILLLIFCGPENLMCQEVQSNSVKIRINTLQDKSPPTIKLITPTIAEGQIYQTDTEEIDIIGEVNDESGVKFVSVNSDIRQISEMGVFSSRVKLYPGQNRIRVVVSDIKDNLKEEYITIEYKPAVITLEDKITTEAKYYALIIGIDNYIDANLPNLDNPIGDAQKLYNILISKYTFLESDITFLGDPRRNDIVFALDYLASKVTSNDNVLIFYAGHGHWDEKADIGYWLPSDALLTTTANWFRNSTLVDYLKAIDSKHTLLIADACFAGSIFKTRSAAFRADKAFEILYELPSRKAMTSGTLTEVPDRSSFNRFLVERLYQNKEKYMSSEQLFSSFRHAVINNSDAIPQYGEIRNVGDQGGDFIFLKKE